jgi:hypothetical protein
MTLSRDTRQGLPAGKRRRQSTPPGITPGTSFPGDEWQRRLLPFQASSARLSDHGSSRVRCPHRQCAGGITRGPGRHPRALKASGEHRPENDRDFAIYYQDSHARHRILTSRSLDLVGDRRAAFPAVLVGNQIDSALPVSGGLVVPRQVLGPEHPRTLVTRIHLAWAVQETGDAAGARDQFVALLPISERVLGPIPL